MRRPVRSEGLEAWRAVRNVNDRIAYLVELEFERADVVNHAWFDILLTIAEAPGRGLRMRELGERLGVSRSTLTHMVERLEEARLVRRQAGSLDGRFVVVSLTPRGLNAISKAWPTYSRVVRTYFSDHLGRRELQALREGLQTVVREIRIRRNTWARPKGD